MSIRREDIHQLVEQLSPYDQKSAYDFLNYLVQRKEDDFVLEADNEPLSKEEELDIRDAHQQIENGEVVEWEEIKRGLNL